LFPIVTTIKDKLKTALDESRMLILGSQVLVGFGYRSAFELGFERLSHPAQLLELLSLVILLIVVGLLMSPGAYHRIVHHGEDTSDLHSFTTRVMDFALLPFAVVLAVDVGLASSLIAGRTAGLVAGLSAGTLAIFFWYGLEWFQRRRLKQSNGRVRKMGKEDPRTSRAKLQDKIDQVLTEARVVLPGAQALLGFQFATVLVEGFEKLPPASKYVHLASLALMALSTVLLMAPAAYHRIVENGEESERFHRFASSMLLAAMVPLPLGISGDTFVVVQKVTQSTQLALVVCLSVLLWFYCLWFGYTFYRRSKLA
jgi:hypothetical protein